MSNKFKIENEERLISSLQDIVVAIKTRENPEELNAYKRLFKKAVPFTMRSYVSAYLIKNAGLRIHSEKKFRREFKNRNSDADFKSQPIHSSRPKIVLPENESSSIFIGIGRKRGIFPKDIITLLMQGAGIARDHIGGIRILDNYSFVQVMQDESDSIIEKLNNSYYRGKNITVSHSRKEVDGTQDQGDSFNESNEYNTKEFTNKNTATIDLNSENYENH